MIRFNIIVPVAVLAVAAFFAVIWDTFGNNGLIVAVLLSMLLASSSAARYGE